MLEWAAEYDGPKFHALFCDPPYHLTSITKRFGKTGSAPAKFGRDGAFTRASNGFIGQAWDGGDIAFRPETWAALTAHLHPGGFVMVFAASRGWHRIAVALEDAGLIIHPSVFLLGYAFGSGFPKATQISSQVDRAAGKEPEVTSHLRDGRGDGSVYGLGHTGKITRAVSPLAQTWVGHRYGLQALKPALEPIIIAQKPYEGRPVDNITATGAGALNVDGGRIATGETTGWGGHPSRGYSGGLDSVESGGRPINGRWPSNLILTCTCDPLRTDKEEHGLDCPVRRLGEQSGERAAGSNKSGNEPSPMVKNTYKARNRIPFTGHDDSGTAARFFHQSHFAYEVLEQLAQADPVFYTAKASGKERNAGLDSLPTRTRNRVNSGGLENEPRWAPTQAKNIHPTVKPISLTKYLATLLAPPDVYAPRRLLVPFAGSGSEICGAILSQQWEEIIGIEMKQEYIDIAKARVEFWQHWMLETGLTDPGAILQIYGKQDKEIPNSQLRLPF